MNYFKQIALFIMIFCIPASAIASVYYVNVNNTSGGDGLSWDTAYSDIQDAIDTAYSSGGGDVWVAKGTYTVFNATDGSASTIQMKENVNIYGGFTGSETSLDTRDWALNKTILDGESSVKHVVTGASNAIIDGFTITGGKAMLSLTRKLIPKAGTTVDSILESRGQTSGGGILIFQTAPTINNCIFDNNYALKGGGAYIMVSKDGSLIDEDAETSPTFTNCVFSNNYATKRGGGVSIDVNSHPTFIKCIFKNNTCDEKGGAMYNDWGCSPTLINCLIVKNTASRASAMGNDGASNPKLINCTVAYNYAYDIGAGIYTGSTLNATNDPTLINCIVWGNSNKYGGPTDFTGWHKNHFYISYSNIGDGFYSYGQGVLYNQDPLFTDPDNDDYSLQANSPCINTGADTSLNSDIPSDDLDGENRDNTPDMGAYEYAVKQTGSLTINLEPDEAILVGAKWQLDSNSLTWYDNNTTLTLETGSYIIIFSTLNGYETPENKVVTIVAEESQTLTVTYTDENSYPDAFKGYTLFMPMNSTVAYLIDNYGNTIQSWDAGYNPSNAVYFLENGDLLQTADLGVSVFDAAGTGGRVMKLASDSSTEWIFDYYGDEYIVHHDVEYLSNGNVLMIAYELISYAEATAAARKPLYLDDDGLYSDTILEINPSSGEIVWKWGVWDHLIQEQNSNKPDYGTISDHPEKIDLNYSTTHPDYTHFNSVDYNEELDQILISCRNYNEIWIIDHSTTTDEAASDSGGKYGKGGDLLYRWGNPDAYDAGDSNDQILFGQHDANWIDSGYPGEGNILIFNNGNGRPVTDDNYSSIEEITPPIDDDGNYSLTTGSAYEPAETTWSYEIDSTYYSSKISGAQRLPNGNTLICSGENGYFFEVDSSKNIAWEYQVSGTPNVFKIRRYGLDYEGLAEIVDTGKLIVTISSTDAITAGAQWKLNNGEWHDSGETVNVVIGTHTIDFSTIDGYDSPESQTITIGSEETETITAEYKNTKGKICVIIEPSEVNVAQWTIDNGTSWYDSGTTISDLDVGDYTVSFSDISDYVTPDDQTISVVGGETTTITTTYESEITGTASLTVQIKPYSIVPLGAKWSIDDGENWQFSDDIITGLTAGNYTIIFTQVLGWYKPLNQTISIEEGQALSVTASYRLAQGSATLIVDIKPSKLKTAGAMFKLNDGNWQNATGLPLILDSGNYILTFKDIPGWLTPDRIDFELNENATELKTGQYYLLGDADSNLTVNLTDLIKIQQVLIGIVHDDLPDNKKVLDLSLDGVLGIADVIRILLNISAHN